jgi:hypothetical protein
MSSKKFLRDERERTLPFRSDQPHDEINEGVSPPRGRASRARTARRRRLCWGEGIPAFAERILPRASDLWVQTSLDYKQRLLKLFFPEGIAFDGNRFNRTRNGHFSTTWRRPRVLMKRW